MKDYEKVDVLPPPVQTTPKSKRIVLAPGEILRRPVTSASSGGNYQAAFLSQGRPDYHAATRTVDGIKYLYLWRDPIVGKNQGEKP